MSCGAAGVDSDVAGVPAATAATALAALLGSGQVPGLVTSGHHAFTLSETETIYAVIRDDALITHITVSRGDDSWAVTHVTAPGC